MKKVSTIRNTYLLYQMSQFSLSSIQTLTLRTLENLAFVSLKKGISKWDRKEKRNWGAETSGGGGGNSGGPGCAGRD